MHNTNDILESLRFIESRTATKPTIGIILGSGLGPFADTLENAVHIPYSEIPHFAKSEAVGHANELVIGTIAGKNVVAMKGRFHYYEGFSRPSHFSCAPDESIRCREIDHYQCLRCRQY